MSRLYGLLPVTILVAVLLCTACGGGVVRRLDDPPPLPEAKRAVQISVVPHDAEVFVDDEYLGTLDRYREQWLALGLGPLRLKVARSGYYPWYFVVPAGRDNVRLKVRLVKDISSTPEP